MSQNTSTAVMARRVEAPDSLDFFPTPPWGTRALVEHVLIGGGWGAHQIPNMTVWEPACGEGHMARPLAEYFGEVHASDCHDYGFGGVHDFLLPGKPLHKANLVITNPPFRLASQFVFRAMDVAQDGCAMLVRSVFMEGCDRFLNLFSKHPPAIIAPFAERLPMVKGRVDSKASSATAYGWFVWRKDHYGPTVVRWIPPCRKMLERPGDYGRPTQPERGE